MLTKIDELHLPDHYRLDETDECYFIGEYTAGRGYSHSPTNQLIYNLKKSVERRGLAEYWHKEDSIRRAASALAASLNPEFLSKATFVPVPPSRAAEDPLYDDRMTQVIRLLGPNVDVRELVVHVESTPGAHLCAVRPGPREIYENYAIDESLVEPRASLIAVVDDVLTTGAHFKAMKRILQESYPNIGVFGLFIARRLPNTE
jgi:predicted amidophosphoribosyltransferase